MRNSKKISCALFFCLTMVSCNHKSIRNQALSIECQYQVSGKKVHEVENSPFYDLVIKKQYLICTTMETNPFFTGYNLTDYHKVFEFGDQDRSPLGFSCPFIVHNTSSDSLIIWDTALCLLRSYDLKGLSSQNKQYVNEYHLPDELRGNVLPTLLGKKIVFANHTQAKGLFCLLHLPDNSLRWIMPKSEILPISENEEHFSTLARNSFATNCDNSLIGIGLKHLNIILFSDTSGYVQKEYILDLPYEKPLINPENEDVEKQTLIYCTGAFSSENFFFFVINHIPYQEYMSGESENKSKVLIFNKQGDYLTSVQLDRIILKGAYDEHNKQLITIDANPKENTQLYLYDFDFLKNEQN